ESSVAAAFEAARAHNGPVSILVNNAGITPSAPLHTMELSMWNEVLAINLTGAFLCARAAIADMYAAKWGRIVNVASIAGLTGGAYISAYCASKHGMVGMTRALAKETAKRGVTVNAICPGYVETDSGKVGRAMKSTYKRHGTLNLFAALEVGTGQVRTKFTEYKKREDFRAFLDGVLAGQPQDKEIHVILDNYSPHKRNDDWLAKFEGRVRFHFTPASASWLNQIEIVFSLLQRKALNG
ncbi:MAG: IS630 family transposase, partial [Bryobacteraceae bacterium]|nr:IS630 family transposase [Bryobacteraceae bacterium]